MPYKDPEMETEKKLRWERNHPLHHLGFGFGMYIPKNLHTSVRHSLKTGVGLEEINQKCLEWLLQ